MAPIQHVDTSRLKKNTNEEEKAEATQTNAGVELAVDHEQVLCVTMISLSYILLCGQFLLLLTVILLQCLEGIHSQNSTTAETPAASPGQGASVLPFSDQPTDTAGYGSTPGTNETEQLEYRPPSPVVLCSYLWVVWFTIAAMKCYR